MDADQLQTLAINARLNHWPPHLGVTADAEKIEYLAQRLEEAAEVETHNEDLSDQLETAEQENKALSDKNADLEDQVKTLKSDIRLLRGKIILATEALA